MSYIKTNYINESNPSLNDSNLNKIEEGIKSNSIWKKAICQNGSFYKIQIESWETIIDSFMAIHFDDSLNNLEDVVLQINNDVAINLKNSNNQNIKGVAVSNKDLLVRYNGESFIAFSSNEENEKYSKEIGEVGITYLNTPPHNCIFITNDNILKSAYPKLWLKAENEIASGNNTLFVEVDEAYFKIKLPQFPVSYLLNDGDFGSLGKQAGEKKHTLTVNEMPSHNHSGGIIVNNDITGFNKYYFNQTGTTNGMDFSNSLIIGKNGGDQSHNNLPPYTVVNYWICYDEVAYTENINNLDNKVLALEKNTEKNIITASLKLNTGELFDNNKINFDKSINVGDKLSLVNGSVVIGSDVNKVLVSGAAFINNTNSTGYLWAHIMKNNESVATNFAVGATYKGASIPSCLIEVAENDIISIILNVKPTNSPYVIRGAYNSWLTVEVIE